LREKEHAGYKRGVQDQPSAKYGKENGKCVPVNKNQQDALFTFNLFHKLTSTCFEHAYCSPSGGTTLYIQQLVYVMLKIMEFFKIT